MTVHELNIAELEELKETYFQQLLDTDPEVLGNIESSDEISDWSIYNHYEGIEFVKEDFFCNL